MAMLSTVAVALAGCVVPGECESVRVGSSVVNVHWEQYSFVDPVCRRKLHSDPIDSDPPQFATGCEKMIGHDCYVYTDAGRVDVVGDLVQGVSKNFSQRNTTKPPLAPDSHSTV